MNTEIFINSELDELRRLSFDELMARVYLLEKEEKQKETDRLAQEEQVERNRREAILKAAQTYLPVALHEFILFENWIQSTFGFKALAVVTVTTYDWRIGMCIGETYRNNCILRDEGEYAPYFAMRPVVRQDFDEGLWYVTYEKQWVDSLVTAICEARKGDWNDAQEEANRNNAQQLNAKKNSPVYEPLDEEDNAQALAERLKLLVGEMVREAMREIERV
jgi:hypothetical protein